MPRTAEVFHTHRGTCFAVAYRMLGSVADAEDVVQETWLRWDGVDHDTVVNTEAYLVRTTTRVALNKLRAQRARREEYVGPWLPEPLVTECDAAENPSWVESLSAAMLVVLESLSPLERAVFVLHEVFGYPHDEIAGTLERSSASVRQLARRAREHVQARRPRFDTDRDDHHRVTERFLTACRGGDMTELLTLLTPGVTLHSDGGGKVRAARNPITGATKVARFLSGTPRHRFIDSECRLTELGGEPGIIVLSGGRAEIAVTLTVINGLVERIGFVLNPDKLTALHEARTLHSNHSATEAT